MNYEAMAYDFLLARCRGLTLSPAKAEKKARAWWGISIEEKHFHKTFTDLCREGKVVFDHDHGNERFYYIYPE